MSEAKYVEPRVTSYLYARASKMKIPICGTFELSPVCNFNCKMCYVHMTQHQVESSGKKMMKYEDWISLAKQAKEEGMLYLLLTGGEPFLYPRFKELYEELADMGFVISINSNGALINEETVEWLCKKVPSRINITLYGASNETYEKLTGTKNGFDKVSKAIDLLKKAGISVKLNCSLTPYNVDDLADMIEFARKRELIIEVATYMFPAIRLSTENIGKNNRFTPEEVAHYKLETIRLQRGNEAVKKYAKDVLSGIVPCAIEECLEVTPDGQVRCRAGKAVFWMTWYGKMLPCGMMVEPGVQFTGDNFKEAWQEINKQTSNIRLSGICDKCTNKDVCHVCAAMAYAETGVFEKTPTYLCKMVDAMHDEALTILNKEIDKEEDK